MTKWNLYLAGACVAGMAIASSAPAFAEAPQGFAGTLMGGYGSVSGSGSADIWSLDGQAAFGLGMANFGGEIDGGYHRISPSGGDLDMWNIGGSAFWSSMNSRLGGTVQYQSLTGSGTDVSITNYGAFGEIFMGNAFTAGINGGGWSGDSSGSSSSGGYVGGGVTGYVMPNLAISGIINYFSESGGDLTSYGVQAEWLLGDAPLSIVGGYTRTDVGGGGGNYDVWRIAIKFYTDGNGTTLVAKHRNGALDDLVRPSLRIFD